MSPVPDTNSPYWDFVVNGTLITPSRMVGLAWAGNPSPTASAWDPCFPFTQVLYRPIFSQQYCWYCVDHYADLLLFFAPLGCSWPSRALKTKGIRLSGPRRSWSP